MEELRRRPFLHEMDQLVRKPPDGASKGQRTKPIHRALWTHMKIIYGEGKMLGNKMAIAVQIRYPDADL